MESADTVEGHLPRTRTNYGLEEIALPISFRFPTRAIPGHPSTMPVERLLIHARESRLPSFGGLLLVTKDRRIQGRANEKRYRLLVQGL